MIRCCDSFIGTLTKTLHKKIGSAGGATASARDEPESAEFNTKKVFEHYFSQTSALFGYQTTPVYDSENVFLLNSQYIWFSFSLSLTFFANSAVLAVEVIDYSQL